MKKKAKILIFCMIFVAGGVFSQNTTPKTAIPGDIYKRKAAVSKPPLSIFNMGFHTGNNNVPAKTNMIPFFFISGDYYTQHFGFFCKKELQFERSTGIPFKFRLGSVQYCDWMEGKRSAGILPGH